MRRARPSTTEERAYVKMSRAKERSTVYIVADSMAQAEHDLRREWADRRLAWIIESAQPDHGEHCGRPPDRRGAGHLDERLDVSFQLPFG